MAEKVAVETAERGVITLANDLIKHSFLHFRLYRLVDRVIVEWMKVIAGDKRSLTFDRFEIFNSADFLYYKLTAAYLFLVKRLSHTVCHPSAHAS